LPGEEAEEEALNRRAAEEALNPRGQKRLEKTLLLAARRLRAS
jgi:hypothetical protein